MNNNGLKNNPILKEDLTGRDRLLSNVLFSWGSYLVFVVAGFVMPRMIDRHLGQVTLGIWDFCWSLVSYLNLAGLGIGSSVNRYVAKYRAANDIDKLRKAVSSVMCIQLIVAAVVLIITGIFVWLLPVFFQNRLGINIKIAQSVVGFLGASFAIQMALDTSRGVITGCHRWDLHNFINSGSYAVTVVLMIAVLLLGGNLNHISLVYLCAVAVSEVTRTIMAYRICPELHVSWKYVSFPQAREMLLFGGKSIIAGLPQLLLVQTNNILIASFLGPASLAVISRPIALVRHMETFMNKFAFVLTPTTSSLQGSGQTAQVPQFLLNTTRYGVAIVLPMVLFLAIFGDVILKLWMGTQYANGALLAILAAGYMLPVSQNSVINILTGLNMHGRVGLINLILVSALFGLGIIIINFTGWSLSASALLIAVPLTIGNGIFIPVCACSKLGIPITKYIRHTFLAPFLCALVPGLCMALSRILLSNNAMTSLGFVVIIGTLLTALIYWKYIFPESIRSRISGRMTGKIAVQKS